MIAFAGLMIGLLLVPASGGRLHTLGEVRLKYEWVVLLLFLAQGIVRGRLPLFEEAFVVILWASITLALLVVLATQPNPRMTAILCAGLAANLFVTLLNGGMPVLAKSDALPATAAGGTFYHAASKADSAVLLADVLPAPGGWLLSLGDMLLMVGTIAFVVSAASRAGEQVEELAGERATS